MEEDEDLEDLKDGAQVRMMLWLEMEKEKSHFAEEVKLIGGDFAVYAETVRVPVSSSTISPETLYIASVLHAGIIFRCSVRERCASNVFHFFSL